MIPSINPVPNAPGDYSERVLNVCRVLAIIAAISAPVSTAVASAASVLLLIAWALSGCTASTLRESWRNPVGKLILAFYAWLIIGTLYAETDWAARLTTLNSWRKLAYAFLLLGIFNSVVWKSRFVRSYCLFMTLGAVLSVVIWATKIALIPSRGNSGIWMTNYSTQSFAFIAALLGTLTLLLKERLGNPQRVAFVTSILFLTFGIFIVSSARSAYVAAPVAIIFLLTVLFGTRKLILISIGTTLLGATLIGTSPNAQQRIHQALQEAERKDHARKETSIGARKLFYETTLHLIKEKPVIGFGTSGFHRAFVAHLEKEHPAWTETTDPHNQYLFILAENGIIGLILFFGYIYTALKTGVTEKPYGIIAAGLLVAISTSSLFNSHFKTFAEGYLLALFIGALMARTHSPEEKPGDA